MNFELTPKAKIQSDYLKLIGSGYQGSEYPNGNHLRWFFDNKLGDLHLPIGDKGKEGVSINGSNDYVNLYRIRFQRDKRYIKTLSFREKPYFIHPWLNYWTYKLDGAIVRVTFNDFGLYLNLRLSHNYRINSFEFYQAYCLAGGLVTIKANHDAFFYCELEYKSIEQRSEEYGFQLETFSKENDDQDYILSNRVSYPQDAQRLKQNQIIGDDMRMVRFRSQNLILYRLNFAFYSSTLEAMTKQTQFIGKYSLDASDEVVLKRLDINNTLNDWNRWDTNLKAKYENYKKKWHDLTDSWYNSPDLINNLKEGVQQCITDISSGVLVSDILNSNEDSTAIENFNALHIASYDYHIARILGLGTIDEVEDNSTYLYLLEYNIGENEKYPELSSGQHLYLSTPVNYSTQRIPERLIINDWAPGLSEEFNNHLTINEDGYTFDGENRILRIFVDEIDDPFKSVSFFNPSRRVMSSYISRASLFGMKRGKLLADNSVEENLRELRHLSLNGLEEVYPLILRQDEKADYIDRLAYSSTPYKYTYQVYPIDIFARSGAYSPIENTDLTEFTFPNNLLPPSSIRAHIIQEEDDANLIFSTEEEQDLLSSLNNGTQKLLRLYFEYNHIHDINSTKQAHPEFNHYGEKVNLFLRPDPPLVLPEITLENIGDITFSSTEDNPEIITINPITSGASAKFIGGTFSTHGLEFPILDIISSNTIIVEGLFINEGNTNENGEYSVTRKYMYPIEALNSKGVEDNNRIYTIHENIKEPGLWPTINPYHKTIKIGHPSWEPILVDLKFMDANFDLTNSNPTNNEFSSKKRFLRGFRENVIIKNHLNDTDQTQLPQGHYRVVFQNFNHPVHEQYNGGSISNGLSVQFWNGHLRVPFIGDGSLAWKILKVESIISEIGEPLELIVLDELFESQDVISINTIVPSNYYPGYLCYVTLDGDFNDMISPSETEYERESYFGLRAIGENPRDNSTIYSQLSNPNALRVERIIPAIQPEDIAFLGPKYATPPDSFNKSTFSFKVPLNENRIPYQIVVYRADLTSLLSAIYKSETIQKIKKEKLHIKEEELFNSRFNDFANLILSNNKFKLYQGSNYQLPDPDKDNLILSNLNEIRSRINSSFIPITESPILYDLVSENLKVTRELPIRLTKNPNTDNDELLVTDFNIDGNKKSSFYFYMVRTIGSRGDMSSSNGIVGPVHLINNRPPKAPILTEISTTTGANENPICKIKMLSYSESEIIEKLEIRRTTNKHKAKNWRMMEPVGVVDVNDELEIEDASFTGTDHKEVPYGKTVFYRVCAKRKIKYQLLENQDITEFVPSLASKVISKKLVDKVKPPIPELIFYNGNAEHIINLENDDPIPNLKIKCERTCYGGTYLLKRLTGRGGEKIFSFKADDESFIEFMEAEKSVELIKDGKRYYPEKYQVKVINASGLESGWSRVYVL